MRERSTIHSSSQCWKSLAMSASELICPSCIPFSTPKSKPRSLLVRSFARKKKDQSQGEGKDTKDQGLNDGKCNRLDSMGRTLDASSVENMEGVSHSETISSGDVEQKQLVQVSLSILSVLQPTSRLFELRFFLNMVLGPCNNPFDDSLCM